ncbi:hypothetical protein SAMN02745164_01878 [Marinitoga hydrogenitolerans DSM 16785]|uniref:Uncharacterized protein n=1 Tax=Marinitoga hydrogenitolerans (strain DSM 16785 / JCM 12826 / AT1271) TaxID=1122195 RepID=A0A1M4ZAJ1_MARH1|nr:hypothetical protein [Marinitoga hydrogenitolerans]SHF14586.1 hypothetical protein SAMN02745164_01878 [Marinitoga hydrogenitolerans DSM 16785]
MLEIKIEKDFIMDILNGIVKYSTSDIIRKIFNLSTKIKFRNNIIEIRVLLFKYYIKILKKPEFISGIFEFEHNLPISTINQNKLPKYIKLEKKKLYLYIPENFLSKNLHLKEFTFDNDEIIIKLDNY